MSILNQISHHAHGVGITVEYEGLQCFVLTTVGQCCTPQSPPAWNHILAQVILLFICLAVMHVVQMPQDWFYYLLYLLYLILAYLGHIRQCTAVLCTCTCNLWF